MHNYWLHYENIVTSCLLSVVSGIFLTFYGSLECKRTEARSFCFLPREHYSCTVLLKNQFLYHYVSAVWKFISANLVHWFSHSWFSDKYLVESDPVVPNEMQLIEFSAIEVSPAITVVNTYVYWLTSLHSGGIREFLFTYKIRNILRKFCRCHENFFRSQVWKEILLK